jgi:hypothetical protein
MLEIFYLPKSCHRLLLSQGGFTKVFTPLRLDDVTLGGLANHLPTVLGRGLTLGTVLILALGSPRLGRLGPDWPEPLLEFFVGRLKTFMTVVYLS